MIEIDKTKCSMVGCTRQVSKENNVLCKKCSEEANSNTKSFTPDETLLNEINQ